MTDREGGKEKDAGMFLPLLAGPGKQPKGQSISESAGEEFPGVVMGEAVTVVKSIGPRGVGEKKKGGGLRVGRRREEE